MEKVLIIDDSILQGQVLKNILIDEYEVKISQSGEKGIDTARSWKPSLILLDIVMPGINGFEALLRLHADVETQNIPVILITSSTGAGDEERGLKLGAVDYILKPFNPCIVKARVHTHTKLYAYRKTIENLALMDEVTGIPNRRSYEERSRVLWTDAISRHQSLSIGIMDIDFFKRYNDRYGHPKGDLALRDTARALSDVLFSTGGFAARYGGEEFALLIPDTSCRQSSHIAQTVCRNIEALHIPHEDSSASRYITVSIGGITIIPNVNDRYEDCFKISDLMLYRAKHNGRNQVVWYDI